MISVSGVRGIYGDGLTEEVAELFAYAFGRLYGGPVVVGRDSRSSGEALSQAVFSGLQKAGMDVIDLGLASTPTTEMAVTAQEAAGGIIITASHNPEQWNGLKFLGPDGVFLDSKEAVELLEEYNVQGGVDKKTLKGVLSTWDGAEDYHIDSILGLDILDVETIRSAEFVVGLDAVNGVGGSVCTKLLERLGCTVHAINVEPNGKFPHGAEPVPDNITDLCRLIQEKSADVGFAVDPDVDRLSLVDEEGNAPGEEYTLALATDYLFEHGVRTAACNLSTSQMIDDAAERHGAKVYRAAVGEINVVEKMREVNARIGGEGNGGIIYPALHAGRDAVLGMALILQSMIDPGATVSELANHFTRYSMLKQKIAIPEGGDWAEAIKTAFSGANLDFTDGIKAIMGKSWVHVRPSNTEPVIRVIAEAPAYDEVVRLVTRVHEAIGAK
jgi:phosphomannomutase